MNTENEVITRLVAELRAVKYVFQGLDSAYPNGLLGRIARIQEAIRLVGQACTVLFFPDTAPVNPNARPLTAR
jgi:hypothetical protein